MVTKQDGSNAREANGGGYAQVNGLKMYYEMHGGGPGVPLVLLHGGLGQTQMLGPILPALAAGRRVIAVDLQAHGRTADIDRPLSFEAGADDIAALIRGLGLDQVDVMGYSFGGGAALQTAIRHPESVRKLVLVSTPCKRDGWYPEVRAGMEAVRPGGRGDDEAEPDLPGLCCGCPRPEDWPLLLTKMGELLRQDYDWSEAVKGIQARVMLVFGDADAIRPAHMVEFFELLGGGQQDAGWDGSGMPSARLAILPGVTHYDIFEKPALASAVTPFLDAA